MVTVFFTAVYSWFKKEKKKRPASLQIVLCDAVKNVSFIKSWPWVYLFWTFFMTRWDAHACRKHFAVYRSVGGTSGKSTSMTAFVRWISHFFHRTSFLLERTTDRQITITQTWIFGRHFLKKKKKKERTKLACHFKGSNWQNLLLMIKLKLSSENWNFGKLASATVSSLAPQF